MLSNPTLRPCKSFIIVLSQVSPPRGAAIFSISGLAGRSLVNRPIICSLVWFRPGLFASRRTPSRHCAGTPVTRPAGTIAIRVKLCREVTSAAYRLQPGKEMETAVLCDNSQLIKCFLRNELYYCAPLLVLLPNKFH